MLVVPYPMTSLDHIRIKVCRKLANLTVVLPTSHLGKIKKKKKEMYGRGRIDHETHTYSIS